jgi:CheY-like chemotaxis protein
MGTGAPAPAPRSTEPHAPSLDGVSVLVVDDDVHALEYARSVLEQYGASVALAASAEEARTRYSSQPPDVLVADLLMPGEDGLQLIRAIRGLDAAGGRSTPAAALTALARMDDRRRALDAGYQMHVTKPIDPDELVATVECLARGGPESNQERLEPTA